MTYLILKYHPSITLDLKAPVEEIDVFDKGESKPDKNLPKTMTLVKGCRARLHQKKSPMREVREF